MGEKFISKILGLDLAAKEKNPTGIYFKKERKIVVKTIFSNTEIIEKIDVFKPDIIAIDAPIIKGKIKVRKADRALKKYGAMPPTMHSIKKLAIRGTKIAETLEKQGYKVIEVLPTATAKILGTYDKDYRKTAEKIGIKPKNKHELDAYLCFLTAKKHLQNKTETIGDKEGKIIVPKK
ncbi:MAG: DUF429 domain-containing protein [Candidatus Thermoplasmatota archaeon]